MSKYIDLDLEIAKASRISPRSLAHDWQREALTWLDAHPDQVPGRTITESEFRAVYEVHGAALPSNHYQWFLGHLGITVTPDPEPTNAEKLAQLIRENDQVVIDRYGNDATDELAAELTADCVRAPGFYDD